MIPKRIICTHKSLHVLEAKLKYCITVIRSLHPEWDFIFFSDLDARQFVADSYPEYAELYDWLPRPVLKADLFRLLAVYRLGGFYLDTDMLMVRPLDDLCSERAVFAWEHEISEKTFNFRYPAWVRTREKRLTLANYAFGSESNHPFLQAILEELLVRTKTFEVENCIDMDILHSTGPDLITSVYYREEERWADVKMLASEVMGFGEFGRHLVHGGWRVDNYRHG